MSNPLLELQRLGQSPWHDNIRRELLTSGKLRRMIDDGWITGLTSNPTIFEQAISKSDDYDAELGRLARKGKSAEEIFDALAIGDIRNAADLFRGVYDRTKGADGYVSIEVAPKYARDTQATILEARRLWETVDRPNLMVKIPATKEGIPAIEQSIAAGININVTLIFSLERYEEVMTAYLNGLIRRRDADEPLDHVASVASFFVSRVDTLVDKLLDERIAAASPDEAERLRRLQGKAAIANAKIAYQQFRRKFSVEAYALLANEGARKQRPLWASTSTKNPEYPDTYYIEALVAPDTVDTMPPATLEAYADHGDPKVRIDEGIDEARRALEELAAVGIDMADVTARLERDGVKSFADSFDSLIRVVEERRLGIVARASTGAGSPHQRARRPARRAPRKPARKAAARGRKAPKARPKTGRAVKTGAASAPKKAASRSRKAAAKGPRKATAKRARKAAPARKRGTARPKTRRAAAAAKRRKRAPARATRKKK